MEVSGALVLYSAVLVQPPSEASDWWEGMELVQAAAPP